MTSNPFTSWSAGYVTEVDYTIGFYRELAPTVLNWAAVQRGCRPPEIDRPFTVLELGCGHGYSANILAACNPEGRFYATDFNPAHVVSARRLAAEAGTNNVTFFEDSFAALKERDLPEFDYITLHGVYSWISPENRRQIVDIIARKLKPGGLAYVSYNALPGWSAMAPVRRLLREAAGAASGGLSAKFEQALALIQELKSAGAAYFLAHPSLAPRLEQLQTQNRNYLLHEYLNESWELLYHADVAAEMAEAKLTFVSSANYVENRDTLAFPGQTRALYERCSDSVMKETVRDFATNQQFRRDVFMRGRIPLSNRDSLTYYERTPFVLMRPRQKCELRGQFPAGEVTLKPEAYEPLLDALATGPKTAMELLRLPTLTEQNIAQVVEALCILGALGYVQAGRPLSCKERGASVSRTFNQAVLQRALAGQSLTTLAAPALGCGVNMEMLDQLFLLAHLQRQKDLVAVIWEQLKMLGHRLKRDGQTLDSEADNLQRLRELSEQFTRNTLPLCRQWALL